MKYKVGDKVKICKDLYVGQGNSVCKVTNEMLRFRDNIVTILERRLLCNEYYYIVAENDYYWTDNMFTDGTVKYEDINTPTRYGYTLNYNSEENVERAIREDMVEFLYFNNEEIKYSDIPKLISWLEDVYTYGQQILAEPEIEYVDFQTALDWMKEKERKNKAKLGDNTYMYTHGNLWYANGTIGTINIPQIESKKWVIIKGED